MLLSRTSLTVSLLFQVGCYAEFDIGVRTPRLNACTGRQEVAYVYFDPGCKFPPPPPVSNIGIYPYR